ncbi:hypothetical protein [Pseudonocardia phyllosphaerae]|uniref:hypothetical protein n=1 Tax=Pseudonocardia phyllosphaerae TaxID=3390502 RepID=UPI00397D95FB
MSTPVIERPGTPGRPRPQSRRTATAPAGIPAPRTGRGPAQRSATVPAQRAPQDRRSAGARAARSTRDTTGRAKFVLVVMVLLTVGLVATLWLSTAAAADSYALNDARQRTGTLTEQSEALRKEVSVLQSPGSLAQRATAQGLVPVTDPARIVVAPDGKVDVVGEPQAAVATAPPAPPAAPGAPVPPPAPASPTGDTTDSQAQGGDAAASAGAQGSAPKPPAPQANDRKPAEQKPAAQKPAEQKPADQKPAEQTRNRAAGGQG